MHSHYNMVLILDGNSEIAAQVRSDFLSSDMYKIINSIMGFV